MAILIMVLSIIPVACLVALWVFAFTDVPAWAWFAVTFVGLVSVLALGYTREVLFDQQVGEAVATIEGSDKVLRSEEGLYGVVYSTKDGQSCVATKGDGLLTVHGCFGED